MQLPLALFLHPCESQQPNMPGEDSAAPQEAEPGASWDLNSSVLVSSCAALLRLHQDLKETEEEKPPLP